VKRYFVVDEGVLILAQKGENPHGEPDATCLEFVRRAESNCHSVLISPAVFARYSRQIDALRSQRVPFGPFSVMKLLAQFLANSVKDCRIIADDDCVEVEGLVGLAGVDDGDREFVRLAASVEGAVLATADTPLINALTTSGIDARYRLVVMTPHQTVDAAVADP